MARSGGGEKQGKLDFDESRIDSGIDSYKSISRELGSSDSSEEKDKTCVTDERLDSAYVSSSLTVDSLGDFIEQCSISECESATDCEYTEEEVNFLTTVTEDGDTILHLAIIHEEECFARQLIDLFPPELMDIQNNLYQTPLHLATYLNQPTVVKGLVEKRVSLELQDQEGNTPLHVACEYGFWECANEMIHNASPSKLTSVLEAQNWRGLTCLHVATLHKHQRLMRLLMKNGVDLNIQEGTSGKTAVHMAVELHDAPAVNLLLNKGANVDAAMFNGCTALHLAVGRQDAAIANLLCQAGADKMIRNMEDETALDLADGNDDILALFPFDDIQIMGRTVMSFS
ncbi:NF-kappa-B inhibitor epsilon-like [Sinocyclocheilus anshuiensis]|uniref:NF-kappa-B inhibitor epsilon-like n=1 Tax=Sinocyclocheilus anshuiensis TaxID=1608454 RepID=A0A671K871_9TELE|nr:PREDICTED: NF-kappa-B inhibitor epsilon-like [Sinocyclocheilus anshuiensis]